MARLRGDRKIFLDSGAYSALTQKKTIDVGRYADWLLQYGHLFEVHANLDVIGNADGTWENQQYLESRGLSPIPVFHTGEPWHVLDKLLERYDYIALGGMVGWNKDRLLPWAVRCFKNARATGRHIRFHGFGLTTWQIVVSLPWYTVDSTSWNAVVRFARAPMFDPLKHGFRTVLLKDKSTQDNRRLLRYYGADPDKFLSYDGKIHRTHALQVSARSWRAFEHYCRKRQGPIKGFNGDQDGLHIYLAEAAMGNMEPLYEALK
ncbi:MAG: hypothetical protein GY922_19240 [Proteobacteria bacterium]|nr:hypothetical protein [Pseudomonadota bacterium]